MTSSLATPARLPSSLHTHIKQKPNNQPMSMVVCNRSFDHPPPRLFTSGKHDREMYTPLNPAFLSKKKCRGGGGCRVIPFFLNSDPKHRLWVLVYRVPTINVLNINVKNVIFFFIIIIFATEKILCIFHEQVFVMLGS